MAQKQELIEKSDYQLRRSRAIQALIMPLGEVNGDTSDRLNGTSRLGCEQDYAGWWHGGV